jgi:hypothetical protein
VSEKYTTNTPLAALATTHLFGTEPELARCALCGGPVHAKNGKAGQTPIKVYICGYHQDRAACTNSFRRPVDVGT